MKLSEAKRRLDEMIALYGEDSNHVCIFIPRNEIRDDVFDMVNNPEAVTEYHVDTAIGMLMDVELMYDYRDNIQEVLYEDFPELFDEE